MIVGTDRIGALVHVVDPADSLRQTPNDRWAATPIDRLEALLRENRLIKDIGPRFNAALTDDKTYPYLEITTREDFPMVALFRARRSPVTL